MANAPTTNLRADCAKCLCSVVDQQRSLSDVFPAQFQHYEDNRDKALAQEICFGVLRWLPKLDFFCSKLLQQPLKGKKRPLQFLLYVGMYQLLAMRIPAHAAISETVDGAVTLKAPGLKGLLNGVLRNFQRQQETLVENAEHILSCRFGHPNWIIKQVQTAYPEQWESILNAAQERAPLWLRVNQQKSQGEEYLQQLNEAELAAKLVAFQHTNVAPVSIEMTSACPVEKLPRFADGYASVQDGAAQHAAALLGPQANEKILDACAAPGGKTCHLLEIEPTLTVHAIDIDQKRLDRVEENLTRLQLTAKTQCADLAKLDDWWDGEPFDRILLDAPCSATGVIRRHPDIKWLRRKEDIAELAALQQQLLATLWQTLAPGGTLLYATCSIMPEENQKQIMNFLQDTPDASLNKILAEETEQTPGWQLLPGDNNMDGFYYARLTKANP